MFVCANAGAQSLGERVAFASHRTDGSAITVWAYLWKPTDLSTPKPAVVLIHGSGGINAHREGHYGEALSREGFVVLAVDSFGPRGVSSTVEDQSRVSNFEMTRDAFAARRWLAQQAYVNGQKIFGAGFSKGGAVMLNVSEGKFLPGEKERFAAVVPFYPGCNTFFKNPQPLNPIYMLIGAKDDYTGVEPCQALAAHLRQAGGKVDIKIYDGASHSFDGDPALTRMIPLPNAENYSACRFVYDDYSIEINGKVFARTEAAGAAREARATCMKKGATVWTHQSAKREATADFIRYLKAQL
jgi:dienelactone hydrolase